LPKIDRHYFEKKKENSPYYQECFLNSPHLENKFFQVIKIQRDSQTFQLSSLVVVSLNSVGFNTSLLFPTH
jgi:hypothetical protein